MYVLSEYDTAACNVEQTATLLEQRPTEAPKALTWWQRAELQAEGRPRVTWAKDGKKTAERWLNVFCSRTGMSRLGEIAEFDPKSQNFESYLERFELFVHANDIEEEKKLAVFLTVIGAEAYEVLKNLVVPASPCEKTYGEAKRLLTEHYSPWSSVIAERCRFNSWTQHEGESVENFIVELKHLARKCNYGDFLQDALRDRLVGVRNEDTQRALFAEESLTFDSACKIALDREMAAREAELMKEKNKEESLNAVSQPKKAMKKAQKSHVAKKERCERCGRGHFSSVFWYKNCVP